MLFVFLFPPLIDLIFGRGGWVEDNSNEYVISNYDVVIDIGQDNKLSVTESITADFFVRSHGIYRTLPLSSQVVMQENGKTQKMSYSLKYSNISSSELYDHGKENGTYFIMLGDDSQSVIGKKNYSLSYEVDLGNDRISEFDQFYYNVIGNLWDTEILSSNITLNFPKSVENDLYLYFGDAGNSDGKKIEPLNEQRTTFSFSLDDYTSFLKPGQGATVRVKLEQGYFDTKLSFPFLQIGIFVLVTGIIVGIYFKNHNKKTIIPVVNFTAPEGMTPAEVGYIIDRQVNNKDIASLIVYWASKGYLKIIEENKKLSLLKLKDADSNMKSFETKVYNAIFAENDFEVKVDDLSQKIFSKVESAKNEIATENEKKMFRSGFSRVWIAFLSALVLILVAKNINSQTANDLNWTVSVAISFVLLLVMLNAISTKDKFETFSFEKQKRKKILYFIISVVLLIGYSIFTFNFYFDPVFLTFLSCGLFVLSLYFVFTLNIRTDKGVEISGHLIGLREFIEKAEKDRLEMLVKDNPEMFFDILPYAYVLGVSSVWIEKFEGIAISVPSYIVCSNIDAFDVYILARIIDANLSNLNSSINMLAVKKAVSSTINTISSGSGRSGGSGGGFSGGGFGGGGGGRWWTLSEWKEKNKRYASEEIKEKREKKWFYAIRGHTRGKPLDVIEYKKNHLASMFAQNGPQ